VGLLVLLVGTLAGCSLFNSAPTPNFTWNPNDPLARTDVQFTDLSSDSGGLFGGGGVVAWSWDFGDNDSSPSQNPKHEYEKGGDYTVKLAVTDGSGASATIQKSITVIPSLDGTWTGHITDNAWNQWTLQLELHHSASGGITGTIYLGNNAQPITSASFDDSSGNVQITSIPFRFTLYGTLNTSQNQMSGFWVDLTGTRGEDWSVSLQ
jgi:PKD repeat protein